MEKNLDRLLACLPKELARTLSRMQESNTDFFLRLSEIRLRAGHHAALVLDGRNRLLPVKLTQKELSDTFSALCDGSVYAHEESLRAGYLSAFGYRVGVAGRTVAEGTRILSLTEISSLAIRLSRHVAGAAEVAVRAFRNMGSRRGLLVYSPPGVGKTTLLRDFAYTISRGEGGLRIALVDTRGELYGEEAPPTCQLDVLRDCPIAAGIVIATRTLSPEVIICDEIGSEREADAVLATVGCGVPLVASAHGGSVDEIRERPPMRRLLETGVFGAAVGILRGQSGYTYEVTPLSENAPCFA